MSDTWEKRQGFRHQEKQGESVMSKMKENIIFGGLYGALFIWIILFVAGCASTEEWNASFGLDKPVVERDFRFRFVTANAETIGGYTSCLSPAAVKPASWHDYAALERLGREIIASMDGCTTEPASPPVAVAEAATAWVIEWSPMINKTMKDKFGRERIVTGLTIGNRSLMRYPVTAREYQDVGHEAMHVLGLLPADGHEVY